MADISDYVYGEFCVGLANRNRVMKIGHNMPDYYGKKPDVDSYCNIYRFGEDYLTFAQTTGSVRGFHGACWTPRIWFDLDGETAQDDAKVLVEAITKNEHITALPDDFSISFSGNKGFHLLLENDDTRILPISSNLPQAIKKLCGNLAAGLASFDYAIYDKTRIFRIMNSLHGKSGLHKIPLYLSELWTLTMDEIKELAKEQRSLFDSNTIEKFLNRRNVNVNT